MESEPMDFGETERANEESVAEKNGHNASTENELSTTEENNTHDKICDTSNNYSNDSTTSSPNDSTCESERNHFKEHSFPSDSFSTDEFSINENTWQLGQLAWARMSTFPFWPCQVTYDPNSTTQYQKVQSFGRSKSLAIHVHFFHDQGRHSWIPAHHMLPFYGIEDFRKRANAVSDSIRKKEPKFAAALTIKPNIFGQWQKAVAEAMDVYHEIDFSALEDFKPKLTDLTNNISKNTESTKKRKRKSEENESSNKSFKSNGNSRASMNNTRVENKLELETPPVSPGNDDDLRAANIQKQKRISKKINKLQPPDFEVYFERNYFSVQDQNPDATDQQIRMYLLDIWNTMTAEEKIKYRSTYKVED